jgi:myosin heavy chain 9/10/11/14
MAMLLKNLISNGARELELTEDLRAMLESIREERERCETLLKGAGTSLARMQQLSEPVVAAQGAAEALTARILELEQRVPATERLNELFQALDEEAERLGQDQEKANARIVRTAEKADEVDAAVADLNQKMNQALGLKEQVASFLELETPFRQLSGEADHLRAQLDGASDQLHRLQEQHGRMMDVHKVALAKVEVFDRRHEEVGRALQDKERRIAGIEQAIRGMDGVQRIAEEVKRRLDVLKALGDSVAQKTSALEAQREVIERAVARADDLDRAMRQIDDGLRQQYENSKVLETLQQQMASLQALQDTVLERSNDVEEVQQESAEQLRAIRAELRAAQEEVRKSVERFDFESQGLELVSQRVADVRSALADFEARLSGLGESKRSVEVLQLETRELAAQLHSLTEGIGRLDTEAAMLNAIRKDMDGVVGAVQEAAERAARIEEARPAVEAALRDFERLNGTHALLKDALEHSRIASSEMARVREEQSETRTWLSGVETSVEELRERVADLRSAAPTIEFVQKQAQRVNESMAAIEARRDFVEEMHRRMAELGAQGATLDERSRDLQVRMDAAEQRFVGLATHAEEAERMGKAVASVTSQLEAAEREVQEIATTIAGLDARCESVEAVAERTQALRQEIDQRQHALEEVAKDLERVSGLRQEAAAAAQDLEERTKRLAASLTKADRQASRVESLSTQLEERTTGLQFVEKRLSQFEERRAKWELVEQEIARSLEQLLARQSTVEALQADLDRMFAMAEKTTEDVRAIAAAQREIGESRQQFDDVIRQLQELRVTATGLDERKRQMARAESRLARAEALLVEVRGSVAVLEGQKVVVDQAVEKVGSLQFLLRQAESMIEGLREERDITTRVRAAFASGLEDDDLQQDERTIHAV